jgi:hypothetical protein
MSLHLPTLRLPRWPELKLGQRLADATQTYTNTVSIPYVVAMGLDSDSLAAAERRRRELDY